MNRYRHIIFDLDGTLLDTEEAIIDSLKDTVREILHKEMAANELKFALGIPGKTTLQKLGITDDLQSAIAKWNTNLLKYKSAIRLFDGVAELLPALKTSGHALGIVTSKTRNEYAEDFASHFDVSGYFDTVICADDTALHKPHPDPLLAYLAATGITAHEAIYIGDSIYDSLCARSAGVDFGHATWGCPTADITGAKYIFKTPADILSQFGH